MSITIKALFSFFVILPLPIPAAGIDFRKQVEADWLLQEGYRTRASGAANITPEMDAAGAVDGIKNGKWPFHTGMEKEPWWQVDLGSKQPIARVLIWNRSDSAASRASRLMLRISDDGKTWRTVYQHNG
ncbi:MAG: discoidin domain-containing protein, partial [Planctomycetota bacterium]|nr:discoidin domain-containing protein [Planctomycetota bacterium]